MRLIQYLNESIKYVTDDVDEIKEILQKKCGKIIKIYKNNNQFLYRGKRIAQTKSLILKSGRLENRRPSDTPYEIHDLLNIFFKKKFGWPVRNGVFATSDSGEVEINDYGNVHYFFPEDRFKFCWSPEIRDLYEDKIRSFKYIIY